MNLKSKITRFIDNMDNGDKIYLCDVKNKEMFVEIVKEIIDLEYDINNGYFINFNEDYSYLKKVEIF